MATASAPWTETEFGQLDLGDARLNKRAPPKACQGWGETMAAYRFFDNDGVDWQAIMAPHGQQTQHRIAALPVMLCLQDTSELDFNGQGAFALGPLSYEAQRGMYLHPT